MSLGEVCFFDKKERFYLFNRVIKGGQHNQRLFLGSSGYIVPLPFAGHSSVDALAFTALPPVSGTLDLLEKTFTATCTW
jgi:hypothetical protein